MFGSDEDVIDLKINGKNEELFLKTKSENSYNLENGKFSCQITILNEKETGYESSSITGEIVIKDKNTGEEYSSNFYGGFGC
ncbi:MULTISPECIES: hypothetical protein [Chryseobacterium]|uniref:hypothetical protein n=1 Tax=Chryseobacterium sp. R2A-55 TaxID=2744445 RepID=UPI001F178258|nr:hypothetical protein [Chryseobacterium sp. R2A-55]